MFNTQKGFSLIEAILASSLFALIMTALVGAFLYGEESTALAGSRARAVMLAKEGIEAARNIRDENFSNLSDGVYGLTTIGSQWNLSGSSDASDIFTRQIVISSVDSNRKSVTSNVSWQQNQQRAGSVSLATYFTDWQSSAAIPASCNDYAVEQGYASGTCRSNDVLCGVNGETYLPDGDEYCVAGFPGDPSQDTCCALPSVGGFCSGAATVCATFGSSPLCLAQSSCSWGGGVSGATVNPSFDSDSAGWTYADWETGNQVSGDRQSSGGNPNGYIRVVVAGKKNQTISGYWQQSFATSADNPAGIVGFDWRIPSYSSTGLTSYYLYVFVENVSGAPTLANYVWRSPLITSATNWATVSNLDISSKISATGTYYIKVAARGTYDSTNSPGTTIGAFDNVQLNWTKPDSCFGAVAACDTFVEQSTCEAQGGCLWNGG